MKHKSQDDLLKRLASFLSDDTFDLDQIMMLWRGRNLDQWKSSPNLYQLFGEKVLRFAAPLWAYDILNEGLELYPDDVKLRQLLALTLTRIDMLRKANEIVYSLFIEGDRSEETLGILAKTYKCFYRQEKDEGKKILYLKNSLDYYDKAYDLYGNIWSGINAATLLALCGEAQKSKTVASELISKIEKKYHEIIKKEGEYWTLATLGEANLLISNLEKSQKYYTAAIKVSKKRYGDISTTWENAKLLMSEVREYKKFYGDIYSCFEFPCVMIFSGHMVDDPDSKVIRFPDYAEKQVSDKIYEILHTKRNLITFSSLANGSDVIFVENALKIGAKVNIILPCSEETFIELSIRNSKNKKWEDRFNRIMRSPINKIILSRNSKNITDIIYSFTNEIIYGFGRIQAKNLHAKLETLAVLNSNYSGKLGGASGVVSFWKGKNNSIKFVDINKFLKKTESEVSGCTKEIDIKIDNIKSDNPQKKVAMLFADAVNYSKLRDEEFPLFEKEVLGCVNNLIEEGQYNILSLNTWGDAFYIVFDTMKNAGLFALRFVDRVNSINWMEKGFDQDIKLRVALHAGIVYEMTNLITGLKTFTGEDVCRAARIEGITPPGQVFASMEFATLAEAEHIDELECKYIGKIEMPKKYGIFPTYHVTWNNDAT